LLTRAARKGALPSRDRKGATYTSDPVGYLSSDYAAATGPADTKDMSIFLWKEEYSVDHSEIDTQHKRLFQLADALQAAMLAGKGNAALSKTLTNLIAYTKHHFACEERLMQSHHYPEFARHKALHDELTKRVIEFQKSFTSGRTALTIDLFQFLKDWLTHHIGETDRKVSVYLKTKAA
jgi:hemerythrin